MSTRSAISELLEHWSERDHRYSLRKISGIVAPLTSDEMSAIRQYRKSEATDLPDTDRDLALMELSRWSPPTMGIR